MSGIDHRQREHLFLCKAQFCGAYGNAENLLVGSDYSQVETTPRTAAPTGALLLNLEGLATMAIAVSSWLTRWAPSLIRVFIAS